MFFTKNLTFVSFLLMNYSEDVPYLANTNKQTYFELAIWIILLYLSSSVSQLQPFQCFGLVVVKVCVS